MFLRFVDWILELFRQGGMFCRNCSDRVVCFVGTETYHPVGTVPTKHTTLSEQFLQNILPYRNSSYKTYHPVGTVPTKHTTLSEQSLQNIQPWRNSSYKTYHPVGTVPTKHTTLSEQFLQNIQPCRNNSKIK
jgi:hypothetical protein